MLAPLMEPIAEGSVDFDGDAQTPPEDALEIDLSPSNGFFKVEAQIQ